VLGLGAGSRTRVTGRRGWRVYSSDSVGCRQATVTPPQSSAVQLPCVQSLVRIGVPPGARLCRVCAVGRPSAWTAGICRAAGTGCLQLESREGDSGSASCWVPRSDQQWDAQVPGEADGCCDDAASEGRGRRRTGERDRACPVAAQTPLLILGPSRRPDDAEAGRGHAEPPCC
jgi:hypothetical protein